MLCFVALSRSVRDGVLFCELHLRFRVSRFGLMSCGDHRAGRHGPSAYRRSEHLQRSRLAKPFSFENQKPTHDSGLAALAVQRFPFKVQPRIATRSHIGRAQNATVRPTCPLQRNTPHSHTHTPPHPHTLTPPYPHTLTPPILSIFPIFPNPRS